MILQAVWRAAQKNSWGGGLHQPPPPLHWRGLISYFDTVKKCSSNRRQKFILAVLTQTPVKTVDSARLRLQLRGTKWRPPHTSTLRSSRKTGCQAQLMSDEVSYKEMRSEQNPDISITETSGSWICHKVTRWSQLRYWYHGAEKPAGKYATETFPGPNSRSAVSFHTNSERS